MTSTFFFFFFLLLASSQVPLCRGQLSDTAGASECYLRTAVPFSLPAFHPLHIHLCGLHFSRDALWAGKILPWLPRFLLSTSNM